MRRRCCLVYLKHGHMAKSYHSSVKCLICGWRHYVLLCPELRKENLSSSKDKMITGEEHPTEVLLTNLPTEREVYLKSITIRLSHKGKEICIANIQLKCLFSINKRYVQLILPRIRDELLLSDLPSRGIKLTDVRKDTLPIRVLLGAETLGIILTRRIVVFPSGFLAVETSLGWTILGLGKKKYVINMVTVNLQSIELPRTWELEVLGITDPVERKNKILLEEETLTHFKKTLTVCEVQHYEVILPWLAGHPAICDKYDLSESKLRNVTKRLIRENNFEDYDAVFQH
ncbi:DUF1758 domain-containing protein [Trichonephila inaurata madagascariensis]|uniref:DUF1758 domain-containing protein n=1 Tax=Trichonephila inaurata madagascariensis TaxID=2747483 RepID=A0A8X7C9T5_9ARAC|nr:DUF1758 domain-containing protein [Trichonephila inaurata madagascariensis]